MGGCRCMFRDCSVNSARYPRMHFFKFPVHDKERFMKWVTMSGATQILNLKRSQQTNRAVCARHFRDESFMNFRKDKLSYKQVPTITRISEYEALDYEHLNKAGAPKLIQLEKPTQSHLIPPEGFVSPLDFDQPDSVHVERTFVEQPQAGDIDPSASTLNSKSKQRRIKPKKDNNNSRRSAEAENTTSPSKKAKHSAPTTRLYDLDQTDYFSVITGNESSLTATINLPIVLESAAQAKVVEPTERPIAAAATQRQHEISDLNKSIEELKESNKTLQSQYNALKEEYENLCEAHNQQKVKLSRAEAALLSHIDIKSESSQTPAAPTKAQFFNGVRRYLSASMASLVRMEMFGNAERPWKPDEKQVSVDLLRLGEEVYRYFTDEWRIRMPALREVRNWLHNSSFGNVDDDEDL